MENLKSKKMLTVILAVIIGILTLGLVVGLSVNLNKKPTALNSQLNKVLDEKGQVINDGEVHDMPMQMLFTPKYSPLEIPGQPMVARILANIYPTNVSNKNVDWSLEFVNEESEWANGKNISDYVTVVPNSDGSLNATVTCSQAFGEQMILTATSRDNPEVTATCLLDYKQQYQGVDISVSQTGKDTTVSNSNKRGTLYPDFETDEPIVVSYTYKKSSVYTVALQDSEITGPSLTIEYKPALTNALNGIKEGLGTAPIATAGEMSYGVNLLDSYFVEDLSLSETNSAISALDTNKSGAVLFKFYNDDNTLMSTYTFTLNVNEIKNQMKVESLSFNTEQIVFGDYETEYTITYRKVGSNGTDLTLFEVGSEYGLSKMNNGYYPETYKAGESVQISNLKSTFLCSGPMGQYHSGGNGTAQYNFYGWFLDSAGTIAFDGTLPAGTTGNITLYAGITMASSHPV